MLTVDYRRSGCGRATACSTSAAASAATPSRRPGWGPRWWRSTPAPTRSARSRTPSGPWWSPASSTWPTARAGAAQGDALRLPFADGAFDRVIASEVLEHIPDDEAAMAELARVLRPGGTMAVTVPRCGPEFVNWALSDDYHDVPGGHVRIYRRASWSSRLQGAGLRPVGSHHAHGLHSPYWWLRCLVGPTNDGHPAVRRLPPAAGVGHREGPEGHPRTPTGCSTRCRQEPGRLPREARRSGRAVPVRPTSRPGRDSGMTIDPRRPRRADRREVVATGRPSPRCSGPTA